MDARYREGYQYGLGFEGCSPFWPHDPSKYNEHGMALDPQLKEFLKTGAFLTKEEFDYASIRSQWIPGI